MKLLFAQCSDALKDIWTEVTFYIKHQFFFVYASILYALLKKNDEIRLHLGCGDIHVDEWVNIDILKSPAVDVCVDLRRGFPFKRNSVSRIYSEHTFEHFTPTELKSIFYQSHRVLQHGESLYFNIPDFEKLNRSYLLKENDTLSSLKKDLKRFHVDFTKEPRSLQDTYYFDLVLRQLGQHKFYYTFPLLKSLLLSAGFRKVRQTYYMPHSNEADIKARKPYSLFVEAVK